jgi:hypothetical protein
MHPLRWRNPTTGTFPAAPRPRLPFRRPPVVGLVDLHVPPERLEAPLRANGSPHRPQHAPRRLIGHAQRIAQGASRDAVLPQPNRQQPFQQRGAPRLEDRPTCVREVVATGFAAVANPAALPHGPGPAILATRTADPVWPKGASDQCHACSLTGNVVPVVIQAHPHSIFGASRSASAMSVSENQCYPRGG